MPEMTQEELDRGWAFSARCSAMRDGWFEPLHLMAVRLAGEDVDVGAALRSELPNPMFWPLASRWLLMRSAWLADCVRVPESAWLDSDQGRASVRAWYVAAVGDAPRHASWIHAAAWLDCQR